MTNIKKVLLIAIIMSAMICSAAFATEVQVINEQNTEILQTETQEDQNFEIQPEITVKKGMISVDILNVRSGPSTNNEKLGKLSLGTTVEIISEADGWYEISFDSKPAYLFSEYVTIIDDTKYNGSGIVEYAKAFLGTPYAAGGNTPKGFDCSGFVQYVMANFSVAMPRTSTDQYSVGVMVDKSQLKPGDLVFFKYTKSSSRLDHVGIYVGDGNFIHSPVPGQTVKISTLTTGYFSNYYYGATRVMN